MPEIQNYTRQYLHEFVQLTSDEAVHGIREDKSFEKHLMEIAAR